MSFRLILFFVTIGFAPTLMAQSASREVTGTWEAETPDGPRHIIVRSDSSASFGEETVRWRLAGDSIHIAFGDEWMVYAYEIARNQLIFSGGDLEEPISLVRVGPPTPLPEGVEVPPAPPLERRAVP